MKILVFAPHSGIWVHAFPEALLADSLRSLGNQIEYIVCEKDLSGYCITMSAYGYHFDSDISTKEQACSWCISKRSFLTEKFHFNSSKISDFSSAEEISEIRKFSETEKLDKLIVYEEDSVKIGRAALYDVLLKYKKNSLSFNPAEEAAYRVSFYNTLLSRRSCVKWMEKFSPDAVIIYNTFYAVNRVVGLECERKKIPVYTIHAGDIFSDRLSRLMIMKDNILKNYYDMKSAFVVGDRNIFYSKKTVSEYLGHIQELLSGQHFSVYSSGVSSSKNNIKDFFGLKDGQKLVVATMSSYDEVYAAEQAGFADYSYKGIYKNQIEWLEDIISFFRERQDLFLVIRIHPREFPNKREKYSSDHGLKVKALLVDLPSNCKVNLPEDSISLYSLALEADLFLNAWSTAGEEMAVFGLPVLLFDSEIALYPAVINVLAKDREDYFSKIDTLIEYNLTRNEIENCLQWLSYKFNYTTFSIAESYSEKKIEDRYLSFFQLISYKYRKWKIKEKSVPKEEEDILLKANTLKAAKYVRKLIERDKESLYEIPEFISSFKRENPKAVTEYFVKEFVKLHKKVYGKETYDNSRLKKRWEVILGEHNEQ